MMSSSTPPSPSRLAVAAVALLGASAPMAAVAAQQPPAAGIWDLKLENGTRQCRMVLRPDVVSNGHAFGMPGGCRLAFPFLKDVKTWNEVGEGAVQFDGASGEPLVAFEPGAEGLMTGTGPGGEVLQLVAVGRHQPMAVKATATAVPASEGASQPVKPAAEVAPKLATPTVAGMAGRYAVLRKLGRDTGCMVTLDDKGRGPGGSLKANLAPACRDQGIVIFDPVGWQLRSGELVLTARKGHSARFELQGDGAWTKDAKDGAALSLKRM